MIINGRCLDKRVCIQRILKNYVMFSCQLRITFFCYQVAFWIVPCNFSSQLFSYSKSFGTLFFPTFPSSAENYFSFCVFRILTISNCVTFTSLTSLLLRHDRTSMFSSFLGLHSFPTFFMNYFHIGDLESSQGAPSEFTQGAGHVKSRNTQIALYNFRVSSLLITIQ